MRPNVGKIHTVFLIFTLVLTIGITGTYDTFAAGFKTGDKVPVFNLKDFKGNPYDLVSMKDQPMVVIYFFDVDSRSSQEGLLTMDALAKKYKDANLQVWGITKSSKEKVTRFVSLTEPVFPILLDDGTVSNLYNAQLILPTISIVGPELKLLDYYQGGGKTTEIMLVKLAERTLQQKKVQIAKAISEDVVKKNPANVKAKTVQGYAALKEGKVDEAEKTFYELSREKGEGEILGKEGLTTVYAKKGQTDKAMDLAKEVEKSGTDRAYVHVVKGDLLYSQNKKKEAEAEYKKAISKKKAEPYQKAVAYNQLGRIRASNGDYGESRELYEKAVSIDPYYIEATSNKGLTYEREGNWAKALENYRQALAIDKNDPYAAVLAKNAKEMLLLQQDAAKKNRVDQLVKDLVARYKAQASAPQEKPEDEWTSRPMVISFVDFMETGGLSERDGFSTVLAAQLTDQLNASGRVQVVERMIIEKLLEELNLGSSEIADTQTALKLGKVLSAKVIGTGSIFHLHGGSLMTLRLIDTETSAVAKVINNEFSGPISIQRDLHRLNREILTTIIQKYPLRAYVVEVTGNQVLINLGAKQGVVMGSKFDVIEQKPPIEYRGKKMYPEPTVVAQVEVVKLEPDFSYAHIKNTKRPVKPDDKLRENIDVLALQGKNTEIW